MKQFTYTVAKIKNSAGNFEPIPALRGQTSYEAAVEAGYKGTPAEWLELTIRMVDGGWLTMYETLDANKANSEDVYTKTEINEQINNINENHFSIASYLALAGNANEDSTNAALGMNNEDNVVGIGKALAMYAKFKDPTLTLQSSFPNLMSCGKLSKMGKEAVKEINNSECLRTLFSNNEYAFNNGILPNAYGVVATKDEHSDITFTIDGSSYVFTASWNTAKNGLDFIYSSTASAITGTFMSGTSTASFNTNGAKYIVFRSIYVDQTMSDDPRFGVIGDNSVSRYVTFNKTGSTSRWYAIEVSDFTLVRFSVYLNDEDSALILDNFIFTDFLPVCEDMEVLNDGT